MNARNLRLKAHSGNTLKLVVSAGYAIASDADAVAAVECNLYLDPRH